MWYLAVFFSALLEDSIPVFAPPAWMVLTFLLVQFDLSPWIVVPVGVAGCTAGRLFLSWYMLKVGRSFSPGNTRWIILKRFSRACSR